jgi:hypothetical protein
MMAGPYTITLPTPGAQISSSLFGAPVKNAIDDLHTRVAAVEAGAWSGAVKIADTSRASTITLADDPHLSVPILANGIYRGESTLYWNAATATPDARIRMTFPSSDFIWTQLRVVSTHTGNGSNTTVDFGGEVLTGVTNTSTITGLAVTTAILVVIIDFTIIVGGSNGNLVLQWAQNTSDATSTVLKKGSSVTLFRQG